MKFRVDVKSTKLIRLQGGADGIEAELVNKDGLGKATVQVPIADAGDYKAGDVVIVEVRVRRDNE